MADNHQRRVLLFLNLFSCFLGSSFGYQFVVGGRDGWIVSPSENYNRWAERNRFQVNDTLLFQYKKGSNSVLVVNKDDYDKCNTGNPILKLDDGNSVFKFDRSGPFYFISGDKSSCDQGQKLIIVVLAIRSPPLPHHPPTVVSPPTSTPSPTGPSRSPISPSSGAPTPATKPSPTGPSGAPISPSSGAPTPATKPSPTGPSGAPISPSSGAPTPATSPSSPSPADGAPTPANSPLVPSPATGAPGPATLPSSPSLAPEAPGPVTSVSGPSPASTSPDAPSASIMPGSPGSSTPGAPDSSTPGSGRPGDVNSPPSPPRSLAAPSGIPSIVLISAVMSVVLGGFMV